MSKYHNTYQRIYQEKYRFLDTVTQPLSDNLSECLVFRFLNAQFIL